MTERPDPARPYPVVHEGEPVPEAGDQLLWLAHHLQVGEAAFAALRLNPEWLDASYRAGVLFDTTAPILDPSRWIESKDEVRAIRDFTAAVLAFRAAAVAVIEASPTVARTIDAVARAELDEYER